MRRPQPHTLLCTIGTSLLYNLVGLKEPQTDSTLKALAKAYSENNWIGVQPTCIISPQPIDSVVRR